METVDVCLLAEGGRADAPEEPYHHNVTAEVRRADLQRHEKECSGRQVKSKRNLSPLLEGSRHEPKRRFS